MTLFEAACIRAHLLVGMELLSGEAYLKALTILNDSGFTQWKCIDYECDSCEHDYIEAQSVIDHALELTEVFKNAGNL